VSDLAWTDTLNAPRSLATRDSTAVAIIEDPGVIELRLAVNDLYLLRRCNKILGAELPSAPWQTVPVGDMRLVWLRPWRWQILVPRERVRTLIDAFTSEIETSILADLTGGLGCFRVVGETADEILARVCPLDLGNVEPDRARGTSIAGVRVLLIREQGATCSWLALAPRSYAEHVGAALIEAARTPGRLGLFKPAPPPQV
jgi:heterotetrameric sarcosine oxidase gamma subunit